MSDQLVTKFKFVFDDNDEALDRWLEDLARKGLHLQRVDCLRSRWVFKRGEPAEMTYRLDFRVRKVSADYLQLFADAGWNHVDSSVGWHVWRTPSSAKRTPEIFTDIASRVAKYKRLLWVLIICQAIFYFGLVDQGARAWDAPLLIVRNVVMITGALYATGRMLLRIRKLRCARS